MENLAKLFERIESINWVNVVDGRLVDSHGMTLSLRVETSHRGIQSIFSFITPNGKSFYTWGAESLNDSNEMAIFFNLKKEKVREIVWEREIIEDKMCKAFFFSK